MNLKVLDLSHHNAGPRGPGSPIDFQAIRKAGVVGIIHKSSEGLGFNDREYARRRVKAKEAGLLWGAYHFNTGDDPAAQVQHFLHAADPDDKTLMALDWEANKGHDMNVSKAISFLEHGEATLGRKLVLYSGNVAKEQLKYYENTATWQFFGSHRLWLCQYGPTAKWHQAWSHYWLWQYTDGTAGPQPHHVPGVSGLLDCNHYDGSDEKLAAEWVA